MKSLGQSLAGLPSFGVPLTGFVLGCRRERAGAGVGSTPHRQRHSAGSQQTQGGGKQTDRAGGSHQDLLSAQSVCEGGPMKLSSTQLWEICDFNGIGQCLWMSLLGCSCPSCNKECSCFSCDKGQKSLQDSPLRKFSLVVGL